MAIEIKQAVARARTYLEELFPVQGPVELEEVEPHPSLAGGWLITFSYDREQSSAYWVKTRVYKVVTVNSEGQPESVKIRSDAA